MSTVDSTLVAAVISALVAFVIVFLNTFVLEPNRRKRDETELREQQLSTWISDMKSNLNSLEDQQRQLRTLDIDDRPLDRVALKHSSLVRQMTDVRRRILDLNEMVQAYHVTMGPQLGYVVLPDPSKDEPYPTALLERGDLKKAQGIREWRDNMVKSIDQARVNILPKVKTLIDGLEHALALEKGE